MKKRVALALAGTAAAVAGGLRLIQELVHRDDVTPDDAPTPAPGPASPPRAPEPAAVDSSPGTDLKESSKAELYEVATGMDIAGRSKMNKAELIKAIEAAS